MNPAGGPAYAVSPVHTIPVPQRETPPNPVAHDTQSAVPTAACQTGRREETAGPADTDAFEIPGQVEAQSRAPTAQAAIHQPTPPNQVYSRSQQAVSNPLYSMPSGGGQVGIGPTRLWATGWAGMRSSFASGSPKTGEPTGWMPARKRSPAIVNFTIMRDGTISDPRSCNRAAIHRSTTLPCAPCTIRAALPPLPPQITESSISAQFTFNLR